VTDITIPAAGRTFPGYLAVPGDGPGRWPGVVVIHEALGLNAGIRAKADELAAHGYLALAPDAADSWRRIYAFFGEHLSDQVAPR